MIRKRRHNGTGIGTELATLVDLTRQLPGFSLVGFDSSSQPPRADVASLPFDERSPAAGMFGMKAPREWQAMGVTLQGVARQLGSADAPGGKIGNVVTGVVVTRDGEIGSFIGPDPDGDDDGSGAIGALDDTTPDGLVVDAMHRVFGLPSPGEQPDAAEMIMCLWLDDILTILRRERRIDWAQMVRIHPAIEGAMPTPAVIPPSDEMIVEATRRSREYVDWTRVHRRATNAHSWTGGLNPEEVKWMDTTMFARWTLSLLPNVAMVTTVLSDFGCHYEAERLNELSAQLSFTEPAVPGAA